MGTLTDLVDELLAGTPVRSSESRTPAPVALAPAVPKVAQSTRRRASRTVGRDPVLLAGRELFGDGAVDGAGPGPRHLALVGEAGLGKSRLLHDLQREAAAAGLVVGRGRGAPAGRGEPYRPLAEAVSMVAQEVDALGPSTHPSAEGSPLVAHRAALGRLVPSWSGTLDRSEQPLSSFVVAEAVAALAGTLGRPVLIVLDDLQWADPETLEVLEALSRRGGPSPYRLLLATRPAGAAEEVLAGLERDAVLDRWRLGPLSATEVGALAEDVLDGRLPPALVEALVRRSDCVPLVVEELVNGLLLDDVLVRAAGGGYEPRDDTVAFEQLAADLPASVRGRLDALDHEAVRVARGAALLGREFAATDVVRVTGLAADRVRDGLTRLLDQQVVEGLSGSAGVDHRFVHALTREAVLSELDGPQLAQQAAAVLDSGVLDTHDDSSAASEQAGELALLAGRDEQAVDLLRRAGRLSARRGALASAERQLRRAVSVASATTTAPGPSGQGAVADLVEVLALAGRHDAARRAGEVSLPRAAGRDLSRLRLGLARAAEATGDLVAAEAHARAAQESGADEVPLQLLRSRLALAGRRLADGQDAALAALRGQHDPEQACEALELLARCARTRDESEAEALLERMASLARTHRLAGWELRALSELGTIDLFRLGNGARLLAAREVAAASGDLLTATLVGYHELIRRFHAVELDGWEALLATVGTEAATYGLGPIADATEVLRVSFAVLAGTVALPLPVTSVDEQLDADQEAARWGIAHTVAALTVDDLDGARASVARGVAAVADREFGDPSPMWGTHALLETVAGAGPEVAEEVRRRGTTVNRVNAGLARWCDAVVAGRADPEEATRVALEAIGLLAPAPFYAAIAMRLARPAALAQGWAEGWDEAAIDGARVLRELGFDRPARALAKDSGRGRHPAGNDLTTREHEVLRELRQGLTNAEIAQRLFISPRTVEKHVERLLAKTGASNRTQLATMSQNEPT